MANADDTVPMWFQLTVAGVVLAIWTLSVLREMTSASYHTPTPLHGIAALVIPAILGRQIGRAVTERVRNNDK